ncbi:4Fe-4S binding protein, partial [Eubacteriales bacterium DFI.9.88]|nr:4Fe-4S binding protein [Eubacteriales bacterium DFI.9.88]
IDRTKCINCMECGGQCPADAIKQWGQEMTVDEAMDIILRDEEYYRSSRGGVTVSGGEPLLHSQFVAEPFRSPSSPYKKWIPDRYVSDFHGSAQRVRQQIG